MTENTLKVNWAYILGWYAQLTNTLPLFRAALAKDDKSEIWAEVARILYDETFWDDPRWLIDDLTSEGVVADALTRTWAAFPARNTPYDLDTLATELMRQLKSKQLEQLEVKLSEWLTDNDMVLKDEQDREKVRWQSEGWRLTFPELNVTVSTNPVSVAVMLRKLMSGGYGRNELRPLFQHALGELAKETISPNREEN